MHRIIAALILSAIYTAIGADAGNLKGYVVAENDWHPVGAAYVSVFSGDSISLMTQTDTDGLFSVDIPADKEIEITVTALGFDNREMKMNTDTISAPILIYLREAILTTDLDEITVDAYKSNVVRRTANGQIFFLSKEAKKEHNPFLALSEIPILNSDYTSSSIKLLDGKQPLILIDGNQVNSGIAPIQAADIESVEVITTVPARYLQEGYSGIVNIKLRKGRAPYIWFGGSYFQYIPTSSSSGPGINFEIGNEKLSVYGSGLYFFARNAKTRSETNRSNTGYNQHFSSLTNSSSDRYYGWLLLKYLPSSKDYLAASFRYNNAKQSSTTDAEGTFITDETENYSAEGSDRNRNSTLSADLYYKHSFADFNNLEFSAGYNSDANLMKSRNKETIGAATAEYLYDFDNTRSAGYFDADYSKTWSNGMSLSVGNHLSMTEDKINQIIPENPLFRNRRISEYLYAALGGNAVKLYYNISAGMESIWMRPGDDDSNYIRPRVSASGTWMFNYSNSLNLAYVLTNEAPSTALLNPRNTSTDPLLVSTGNPLLKPRTDNRVTLTYTFNKNGWYVSPVVSYQHSRDIITPWGYTEEGVYHSTYRNMGRYSRMNYWLTLAYNCSWFNLSFVNGWADHYYPGQKAKGSFESYLNIFAKAKKFYFIAELHYLTKDFTEFSTVRHHNPISSRIHVSYNFTPDFYIAVGLQNFTGNVRSTTDLIQDSFRSLTKTCDRGDGRGFTPYIRIYYNFRKNKTRKINFDNPNFEEMKGISIK